MEVKEKEKNTETIDNIQEESEITENTESQEELNTEETVKIEESQKNEIKNDEENNSEKFQKLNDYENNSNNTDILKIFAILTTVFAMLFLIIFITFTIINTKNQKIAKGIYIKDVDVSGLTKEEATQKISEYISSSIPEEIKLKHNDFETSISSSQLSIYFNTEEAINIAYQIGKSDNIFKNNLTVIKIIFKNSY